MRPWGGWRTWLMLLALGWSAAGAGGSQRCWAGDAPVFDSAEYATDLSDVMRSQTSDGQATTVTQQVSRASVVPPTGFTLSPPLTLTLAIDEARANHPALRAMQYRALAAEHRIPQARALDDPMIGADIEDVHDGTYRNIEYMASQHWPFPGKRKLRGLIAARDADIARMDTVVLERDLITEVTNAYFALYMAERAIEINRHNRGLLEQAERVAEARYASGTTIMQDVLKSQVELAKLSNELIRLSQERTTAIAHLNQLMHRTTKASIVIATSAQIAPLPYTLEELESRVLDSRPEVRAAALAIERAESEVRLAKRGYLPDFTTRVEARHFGGDSGIREVDAMLSMNLPIWFWGKQREKVREMHDELAAAQAMHERISDQARFELRDAYARVDATRISVELYESSILPQAEQSLKVTQAGYESERSDFESLLDAERTWKDFQLEYYRAMVDFELAWADLERAVGWALEKSAPPEAQRHQQSMMDEVYVP